jgi:hypothetical protein
VKSLLLPASYLSVSACTCRRRCHLVFTGFYRGRLRTEGAGLANKLSVVVIVHDIILCKPLDQLHLDEETHVLLLHWARQPFLDILLNHVDQFCIIYVDS